MSDKLRRRNIDLMGNKDMIIYSFNSMSFIMSKNSKKTSKSISSLASQVLRNPASSVIQKELAGSALSQSHSNKQTGSNMESKASHVLQSDKYSDTTKSLAASILSQSNKER